MNSGLDALSSTVDGRELENKKFMLEFKESVLEPAAEEDAFNQEKTPILDVLIQKSFPDEINILQTKYKDLFEDFKLLFSMKKDSAIKPLSKNPEIKNKDDFLSKEKNLQHTVLDISVRQLIDAFETRMQHLVDQIRALPDRDLSTRFLMKVQKLNEEFRITIDVAVECLRELTITPKVNKIGEDSRKTIKVVLVFALLSVLQEIVDSAPEGCRIQQSLYIEYLVEDLKLVEISEMPGSLEELIRLVARTTTAGDSGFQQLAQKLASMEKNGNINFVELLKQWKKPHHLSIQSYRRIIGKKLEDEFTEFLRKELGIRSLLEESDLANRIKMSHEQILSVAGVNTRGWKSGKIRYKGEKLLNEVLWYKIFLWVKDELIEENMRGLEIISGKSGKLAAFYINFLGEKLLKFLEDDKAYIQKVSQKFLEDRILDLMNAITTINENASKTRIGDVISEADLLGPKKHLRVIKRWNEYQYNAFRRVFSSIIPEKYFFRRTQGRSTRFAPATGTYWRKPRGSTSIDNASNDPYVWIYLSERELAKIFDNEKKIVSKLKGPNVGRPENQLIVVLDSLGFAKDRLDFSKRGPYGVMRLGESKKWMKSFSSGIAIVKGEMRDLDVDINDIGKDITVKTVKKRNGSIEHIWTYLSKRLINVRKTKSISPKTLTTFCDILRYWYYRFVECLTSEEYYQFMLDAVYRKGIRDIKTMGKTAKKLKKILMEAHGKSNNPEWEFLKDMSITNLRESTHQQWILDHLIVYKKRNSNEYAIIGIQDKILENGMPKNTSVPDYAAEDIHQLQNMMMGLFNEVKKQKKDGSVGRWGHSKKGIFWNLREKDRERLQNIVNLHRNPDVVVSDIAVIRLGNIIHNENTIITSFTVWEPPISDVCSIIQKFHNAGGYHRKFADTLRGILRLMNELDPEELNRKKNGNIKTNSFWGLNEKNLSSEEAIEIFNVIVRRFSETTGLYAKKSLYSTYNRVLMESLRYYNLVDLYTQIDLLKKYALRIQFASPILEM